ncbi:MAG TPA: CBS domain-containing protein [Coriobacteriia bacterium]
MIYLTRMLGKPVVDAGGEQIGTISDIAISTGEVFPRVTSLAFTGPGKTPFMLSWRKFVADVHEDRITLSVPRAELRFSYLQPDEVLLSHDLLDKQIVDTLGMKVVRVNDLKLSESRGQLRLLGAEVGVRGVLRSLWPPLETAVVAVSRLFGRPMAESIIAWNYMDLLERDLSHVKLSVTHKRLHELHPADVADVLEQLSPSQRARVFEHLDNDQAADAISELEDELQADVLDDLTEQRASDILEIMDPDDAADILGDLSYDKAETLLHLMGVREARTVRKLLGYKEKSAGGIMTPEVTTVTEDMTVQQVLTQLRGGAGDLGDIYYIYVVGPKRVLDGVISLRDLIVSSPDTAVADIVERELFTVGPDDDQEQVAEMMSKYDLLALPVVDESGRILGIVTVDDALDVMEEENAEDLELAMGSMQSAAGAWMWLRRSGSWAVVWAVIAFALAFVVRAVSQSAAAGSTTWVLAIAEAVLFLPVVLRVAEDLSARATTGLIEGPGESGRPPLGRRLLTDALVGIVLGSLAGLAVFAVLDIVSGSALAAASVAAPMAATCLLVTMLSTAVAHTAERAADAGRRVSQRLLSGGLLVLSGLIYLGLCYAAWALVGTAFLTVPV